MGITAQRLDWDKPLIATPFDCPRCGTTLAQHRHPDGGGTIYFHAHGDQPRSFSLVVTDRGVLHRRTGAGHGVPPLVALWGDLMDWCDALHEVVATADSWAGLADAHAETVFTRQTRGHADLTLTGATDTDHALIERLPDGARVVQHSDGPRYDGPILPGGEISGITPRLGSGTARE